MARTLLRSKGRRGVQGYSQLIHAYFQSPEYAELSARAVKLLIDLYCQYRGSNNGDLCAARSVLQKHGWRSGDGLTKARKELLDKGWLMVTRKGGINRADLYAITFMPIDACGGKLDVKATTTAPHLWKKSQPSVSPLISLPRPTGQSAAPPAGQCAPPAGQYSAARAA